MSISHASDGTGSSCTTLQRLGRTLLQLTQPNVLLSRDLLLQERLHLTLVTDGPALERLAGEDAAPLLHLPRLGTLTAQPEQAAVPKYVRCCSCWHLGHHFPELLKRRNTLGSLLQGGLSTYDR